MNGLLLAGVVLSGLALCPSAHAQAVPWTNKDAYHEEATEALDCVSYYTISQQCAENAGRPDIVKQINPSTEAATKLSYMFGQASGTSSNALLAFLQLAMTGQMQSIGKSCMNLAVIIQKYGAFCKGLLDHPDAQLKILLMGPPSP